MADYIFFDLDGTLTDPKKGITTAVQYAAKHYCGVEIEDRDTLTPFIGPPLDESFMKYFNLTKKQAQEAVECYREYYRPIGVFENTVYEGIPELLRDLKAACKTVIMATSKPEIFANQIAEHYGFSEYFDNITGSTLDGSLVKKGDVIRLALERLGNPPADDCIMVGDRLHDIDGGKENGMKTVGVLYGYGSREELTEHGADIIAGTVKELRDYLIS